MRKQYNTVSFKNQTVFVGIDVHKKQWTVTIRHCGLAQKTFSMDPEPEKLADYLKRNYPDAEYRSVYEAGFCGFEAHRALCKLGVQNIVINPADVPTSGKEREKKNDSCDSRKLARELENGSLEPIYILGCCSSSVHENSFLSPSCRREQGRAASVLFRSGFQKTG